MFDTVIWMSKFGIVLIVLHHAMYLFLSYQAEKSYICPLNSMEK